MTVLVGANGCGKSTLLSTLSIGCFSPRRQRGADGKAIHPANNQSGRPPARDPAAVSAASRRVNRIELVSRGRFPWQNVMRQWSEEDERAVEGVTRLTGTAEFAHHLVESLSGGQRQRLLDRYSAGAANAPISCTG